MALDTNNYIFIGRPVPNTNDFYFHERVDENGKPGKIVTMGDGNGDLEEVAKSFIKEGFDPKKIVINGYLASDVFEKQDDKQL